MNLSALAVTALTLAWPSVAVAQTCGTSCPFPGFCPPTFPMGAGPGEDHGCENHIGAPLSHADLRDANLGAVDFFQANLSNADLSGANLSGAYLGGARFHGANLTGANLSNTSFDGADFSGADLTGANFGGFVQYALYDCNTVLGDFDPEFWGWANVSPCSECSLAVETVRLGSVPNPSAFLPGTGGAPILGELWRPRVDHTTFVPNAVIDFILVDDESLDLPTSVGTLLVGASPLVTLTNTNPGSLFQIPVPNHCVQIGATFATQAGSADALGNVALANALDITLGTY